MTRTSNTSETTCPPPAALSRTVQANLKFRSISETVSQASPVAGFTCVKLPWTTSESLGKYLLGSVDGGNDLKLAPLGFKEPKDAVVTNPSSICSQV